MQIPKSAYHQLSPTPRAIAAYMAINRCDENEAEKLIASAPRQMGQGKPFLALGQAVGAYNSLAGYYFISLQDSYRQWKEALAYCEA